MLSEGNVCVLQHAVVKIVREKYLKTTAFESQEELQTFISELYVFLVDQMHVALNQVGVYSSDSRSPWRRAGHCSLLGLFLSFSVQMLMR